jgi:DNA-binding transcriptional LysR family regulator
MELRHLRYFAAVAAHGSFSRAAKQLHLTQPALSRQVKSLEDEIGILLIIRGQNTISLTSAGEALRTRRTYWPVWMSQFVGSRRVRRVRSYALAMFIL